MASTWHLPSNLPGESPAPPDRRDRSSWWARRWSNPMFSGGVIAVVSVLVTMTLGLYIGAEALHVDLGHLGFATLLGR